MTAEISAVFLLGILSLAILFIGIKRGFFHFKETEWKFPLRLVHVIIAFFIYFLTTVIFTKVALLIFRSSYLANYQTFTSWLNFIISLFILIFLTLFLKMLPKPIFASILRNPIVKHPLIQDVWAALYAWVIAFPLVLFLNQLLEIVVQKVFNVTLLPEQIAVKYLKSTFESPLHFTLAILAVSILAPLIEETLFRGSLQSYIRQHLGAKQAILITSFCFSLFHYSAGQGLGNIPIICSLFILSLFLGFIYEKQGSLLAPMVLHSAFNTISVINLYLFAGFQNGV